MSVPTFDTPLSYQARCGDCDTLVGMSDVYCRRCGDRIEWPDSTANDSTTDVSRREFIGGDD